MSEFFSCYFWWVCLGLLLGFLLFWLYDKFFRRDGEDLVEKGNEEIEKLKREHQALNKELEESRQQLDTVSRDGETRLSKNAEALEKLESENKVLRGELAAAKQECDARIQNKEEEIARLSGQHQVTQDALSAAQRKLDEAEKSGEDLSIAAKSGFVPVKNGEDNLTIIEGIGPKISSILKGRGIKTFAALASSPVETLQSILDESGAAFKLAKPGSWPKQAQMCVDKKWQELKQYQDRLVNGVEFDD